MLTFGGLMAGGSTVTGGGSTVTGGGAPGAGDTVTVPGGTTVVSVPGGAVTTVVSLGDVVVVVVVVVSPASSPSLQATNAPVLMAATARTAGDNFLRCVILAPLTGRADDAGVWVISKHGRRAGWAHNVAANPKVRVRVNNEWRTGTATFEPDDDVRARARSFGGAGKLSQSATALTMRAMESDPISVRVTYDD